MARCSPILEASRMPKQYDVVVIGAGLGGLTAAALLARAGRKTLLIERNASVGGAASTYSVGSLVIEASLHETTDPRHPADPKHHVLGRLDLLDAVEWVPVGSLYEVRGGPVGAPLRVPDSFPGARAALCERFPAARGGVDALLGEMERLSVALGTLSRGRDAFHNPREGFAALAKLGPMVRHWRLSLGEMLHRHLGADEGPKCALAANLPYYHDDPDALWWVFFAVAQGGYLKSGGHYIRGGSQRLSDALAGAITAAGGEFLLGRVATAIRLDSEGRPNGVVHASRGGCDEVEAQAPVVVGNAAPAVLAAMLPETARAAFLAPYARQALSISLFSATFGLSVRPAELGFKAYSTFLLPSWMTSLADYRESSGVLGLLPADRAPAMTVVDYSAIDSGFGGPPYPVSVVGPDRTSNWAQLDAAAYQAKRARWREAVIAAIDREFPGLAAHVVTSEFNTARSLANYLNAPDGAIYGFAPVPPSGPIWRGIGRSPKTAIAGLYLASSYAGAGGFTGAINSGASAADLVVAHAAR
jgi:phytoene dehydrogenase-like protein